MKGKFLCPRCNSEMVAKKGKFGDFYGCSKYPECKYTSKVRHVDYHHKSDFRDGQIQKGDFNTRKG